MTTDIKEALDVAYAEELLEWSRSIEAHRLDFEEYQAWRWRSAESEELAVAA